MAISIANNPKRVVNLIIGFNATEEVSLNGSPTVSPTIDASCKRCAFFPQVNLYHFLGIVHAPPAFAIKCLEQTENSYWNEVAYKERSSCIHNSWSSCSHIAVTSKKSKCQCKGEDGNKILNITCLSILSTYFTTSFDVSMDALLLAPSSKMNVLFDIFYSAVGACSNSLNRCARKTNILQNRPARNPSMV